MWWTNTGHNCITTAKKRNREKFQKPRLSRKIEPAPQQKTNKTNFAQAWLSLTCSVPRSLDELTACRRCAGIHKEKQQTMSEREQHVTEPTLRNRIMQYKKKKMRRIFCHQRPPLSTIRDVHLPLGAAICRRPLRPLSCTTARSNPTGTKTGKG